ncbi:MAG: hypothetical protein R3F49_13600 [Planctomycetota bacterium]
MPSTHLSALAGPCLLALALASPGEAAATAAAIQAPARDRAAAAAPGAPNQQQPPDQEAAMEAILGDGIVAVVGRELIRRDDVLASLASAEFRSALPGVDALLRTGQPEDQDRAADLVLIELIRRHLMTEGGRNQGYSPEMIAVIVKRRMNDLQESLGGAVGTSQALRGSGYDPQSFNERTESMLLRQTWESAITGRAAGPTGRANVDRFVPPGLLALEYQGRLNSRRIEDQASVGRSPQRYVLRQVILGLREYEGTDRANEIAAAIQRETRAGTITFDEAAQQFTLPRSMLSRTNIDPLTQQQVTLYSREQYGDLSLAEWVLDAKPGDVSGPFLFRLPDDRGVVRPAAIVVYQLSEVMAPTGGTPFVDPELQAKLRERIQEVWDEGRTERGLYEQLRATYVWPPRLKEQILRRAKRGGADAPGGLGVQ